MKKNGFTLIELLAVIVILAIIALIATPIVLNIIEESKESATIRGAEYYLNALELGVARTKLNNVTVENGTYSILDTGNICLEGSISNCTKELKVDVSGEIPDIGTVTISNGKITDINLTYDDKTVVKVNNELVIVEENTNNNNDNDDTLSNILAILEAAMIEKQETDDRIEGCTGYVYNTKLFGVCYWLDRQTFTEQKVSLNTTVNIDDEVRGVVYFSNSIINSGDLFINDEEFYRGYDLDSENWRSITNQQRMSKLTKFIKALNEAIAEEMRKDPSFVPYVYMGGMAMSENGDKQLTLNLDEEIVISADSFSNGLPIINGKIDCSPYEHGFQLAGRGVMLKPDGSVEIGKSTIGYDLGFDTTSYPTELEQGSLFILDLTGKNISPESLSVVTYYGNEVYHGYLYENEKLYIPLMESIKIIINE